MNKTTISNQELSVLNFISHHSTVCGEKHTTEINEIAMGTGIRDSEEVQRALYLLEGKRLVQPEPPGDFTSNHWKITETGIRALTMLR